MAQNPGGLYNRPPFYIFGEFGGMHKWRLGW